MTYQISVREMGDVFPHMESVRPKDCYAAAEVYNLSRTTPIVLSIVTRKWLLIIDLMLHC